MYFLCLHSLDTIFFIFSFIDSYLFDYSDFRLKLISLFFLLINHFIGELNIFRLFEYFSLLISLMFNKFRIFCDLRTYPHHNKTIPSCIFPLKSDNTQINFLKHHKFFLKKFKNRNMYLKTNKRKKNWTAFYLLKPSEVKRMHVSN